LSRQKALKLIDFQQFFVYLKCPTYCELGFVFRGLALLLASRMVNESRHAGAFGRREFTDQRVQPSGKVPLLGVSPRQIGA
jgi:hypothetical protein